MTTAAVAYLGAGIILHVTIDLRWPFAQSWNVGGPGEGSNRTCSSAR